MTVLVTGGAGYIGSHAVLALLDRGENVVVIDDLSTGTDWIVPADVPFIVGDIGDQDRVAKLLADHGIDAIMHFAGSIVVPDSVADPLGYYGNNTVKSHALIKAAIDGGVGHFIFSSTAAVYGMPDTMPVLETAPLAPVSPYGASKMMTEMMLRDAAFAHPRLRYVALRYFNVAGADPLGRAGQSTPRATHLIKVACETALGKRPKISIFGCDYPTADGTCIRDYVHVTDLAEAHVNALAYLRRGGGSDVFNCGYSKGYSVREVVDAVRRVSGIDFLAEEVQRRPGDPAAIVANADKICSTLGWQPQHNNLDEIVRLALAWEAYIADRIS